jgi:hypothetical protein
MRQTRGWSTVSVCALLGGLVLLAGCPVETGDDDDTTANDDPGIPRFSVQPGSSERICQLTGEFDFGAAAQAGVSYEQVPAHNQTFSRFELFGTDLGASFEHDGALWFLFGDSFSTHTIHGDPADMEAASGAGNPLAADATALSMDDDPSDCVDMTFLTQTGEEPGTFLNPSFDPDGGTVQQDGISVDGTMYTWFSGMSADQGSSIARWTGVPGVHDVLYPVSTSRFIGISAVLMEGTEIPGLEDLGAIDWVLLFGTGEYRQSDIYLAVQPLDSIEVANSWVFYAGHDSYDQPTWSESEADARRVIDNEHPSRTGDNPIGFVDPALADAEGCVGEFSVHFSPDAEAWIATYNCDFWTIELHSAAAPWGPWSTAETMFDPVADGGYCGFIHLADEWAEAYGLDCEANPTVPDRSEPGSPYGPYVIERYTEPTGDGVRLYYVMSSWHPYNTHLMSTEMVREN